MGSSSPVFGVVAEVDFELFFVEVAELLFEPLLPDFVAPLPASLSLPALSPVFELELELELFEFELLELLLLLELLFELELSSSGFGGFGEAFTVNEASACPSSLNCATSR
jgi:hypothetical protein